MLKLFREKINRVNNLKIELNKISTIKLDLSKYSESNLKKTYFKENNCINNCIKTKNEIGKTYQMVFETILGDLDLLNSLSFIELRQITNQIDIVVNYLYIDKETLKQLQFLIKVRNKIQQILIRKAVNILNQARTLQNEVSKIYLDRIFELPVDNIEEMKAKLKVCLNYVDFSHNIEIMHDINEVLKKLNSYSYKTLVRTF